MTDAVSIDSSEEDSPPKQRDPTTRIQREGVDEMDPCDDSTFG